MRRLSIAALAVISVFCYRVTDAEAQIAPSNTPVELFTSCFNDAIKANRVEKSNESLVFTCIGSTAERFFTVLGRYGFKAKEQNILQVGRLRTRYTELN